jgi:hypothetical protein
MMAEQATRFAQRESMLKQRLGSHVNAQQETNSVTADLVATKADLNMAKADCERYTRDLKVRIVSQCFYRWFLKLC